MDKMKLYSLFNILEIIFLISFSIKNVTSELENFDSHSITSNKIKNEGYPVEEHTVVTEDGYILQLYRIPGNLKSQAVLLQHGLLSSSYDWVVAGRNKSLAFILSDHGCDVWLGNARGNTYSRRHKYLSPSNPKFWNFSWHEMGVYDLPAEITYITDIKNDSLIYIGHSMGTTISYVMAAERPEIAAKVKVIFSFASVAYLHHWKSPLRFFSFISDQVETFFKNANIFEVFPQNDYYKRINEVFCNTNVTEENICLKLMFWIFGENTSQFNYTVSQELLNYLPAGSSGKTLVHYSQIGRNGEFRKYDYKPAGNLDMYNSIYPPAYNLSKIQIPIGIFWSKDDLFADPRDVRKFYNALPRKALDYKIEGLFTHTDFLLAMNAPQVLYPKLLSEIDRYR